MLLYSAVCLLAFLSPLARADVEFTTPAAGASVKGASPLKVAWKDSGDAPILDDLTTYSLFLCAGSNENPQVLLSMIDQGKFSTGSSISKAITTTLGASSPKNAYFLKMISVASTGGTIINYSDRFTISGMTGTFPPAVISGLATVKGTSGPPKVNTMAGINNANDGAAGPAAGDAAYDVPYTLQTGPTRYAPMQPMVGTKMKSNKKATPLWPTSSYSIAKTWLPIATVATTVTQSATRSPTSHVNNASPASQPQDAMAKYLARWKD